MERRGGHDGAGPRLGLVLSGGGARGAFQVGVYERLLADERFARGPAVISGTSAGAINAALIAAGKSPGEMARFWEALARNPPVVANERFFDGAVREVVRLLLEEPMRWWRDGALQHVLRHALAHMPPRPGSLLAAALEYLVMARFDLTSRFLERMRESSIADTAGLRTRLVEVFGGERVHSVGPVLAVNTVDARTGQVVRWVAGRSDLVGDLAHKPEYVVVDAITVDMVLASASIPLLFPAVRVADHLLWDGGLLVNTPLAPVVDLGADEIVTVLVTGEPPRPSPMPFRSFGEAVERTVDGFLENAYNMDRKLLLERNRLARLEGRYRDVTLYEAVRPGDERCFRAGSYIYFDPFVLTEMRVAGRRAASTWLATGPRIDYLEPPRPTAPTIRVPLRAVPRTI